MDATEISDLIRLIYETAEDESLWSRLLARIARHVNAAAGVAPADAPTDDPAEALLACLAPHFAKAQDINHRLRSAERERESTHDLLNRLPIGMAIIDQEGGVVSINRSMLSAVSGKGLVRLEANRLASTPTQTLREGIRRIFIDGVGEQSLRFEDPARGKSLSLLLLRRKGSVHATVLAASQSTQALSEKGLSEFFGLTAAESRITQQLALGRTVEEAAGELGIKLSTARTHVQRIFAKVGVSRQPDLLRAIFSSPLWLDADTSTREFALPRRYVSPPRESGGGWLELRNRRRLAYSDTGDPKGLAVLLMHKLNGSRHLRPSDETVLFREGIRLIIPERPGNGDSEPYDGRTILDWPDDVAALADQLEIDQFSVVGHSAGAPYALVTAFALPQRIAAVSVVAGVPPFRSLDDIPHYAAEFRAGLIVAKYAPVLVPSMLRATRASVRRNPFRFAEQRLRYAAESDKRVFADPAFRTRHAASYVATEHWEDQGLAAEILLLAREWGFDLETISIPCVLWHGEQDLVVSVTGARKLADALPRSELRLIKEAGHYLMYSHWDEILTELRQRTVARTAVGSWGR
jgi:pimeloyl-ACP methyl ester carboxylesterase/DNA-binding CsgD family transcriptional regulator/PAS domain-containing protein